jgi:ACT domain-containing protein
MAARVISHSDIESIPPGGTLVVEPDTQVTPLAFEQAQARGVSILRGTGANPPAALVRQVTRQVIGRLGDASPATVEAVVSEIMQTLGGQSSDLVEVSPNIDYCAMCLEQDRRKTRTRAVLTTTGRNTKGIVARITTRIAELGGDILDISQTLVGDYFTMIISVDVASLDVPFADFKRALEEEVRAMGLDCLMMREDVLSSLHRV